MSSTIPPDVKQPGDILHNPALACTLERLAAGGPDLFYHGALAREIAADFAAHGGLLTEADLAAYELSVTSPTWGEDRGHRIATSPPPASGTLVVQLLHILESFDIGAMGHNSAGHIRILAEATKRMTIDKYCHMGDPAYVDVPVERLISKPYCAELAAAIRRGERARVQRLDRSGRETTHVSVVDRDGNAVALTHTLGSPSGAITDGLGFIYNGSMSRFDQRPGHAIGAPGGSYIAPAVAQGISNVLDFGMSMAEAVAAPRIVAVSDSIDVSNRVLRRVTDVLEADGYDVRRSPQSYAFAALHGIGLRDGVPSGGADPQRDGMTVLIP